ncbi:MAG: HD domain-containing protein [Candidatus Eremiobacteraeota bacterium]|nr:HD domain-containing protein [Candidatus Eremiobacteraeota bacterium]
MGGRVRDELRAEIDGVADAAKDLDYVVVGVPQDKLIAILAQRGRVDLVGAAFAILKFSNDLGSADLALPRREISTGHGHRQFAVQSSADISLEEDLARRDFRINMLARALPSRKLVDPYHGAEDLRMRRIDIVRPQAFEEDPLRMLRAAQFAARFRYALSPAVVHGMRASAHLVSTISAERVHDEIMKLLGAQRPSIGFALLAETGVLQHLWPELLEGDGVAQNRWHRFDVWRHSLATLDAVPAGNRTVRLAALLHDVGKPRMKDGPHFYRHEITGEAMSRDMLERMRFPGETTETVAALVRHHMYVSDAELAPATIRRFIRRVGPGLLEDLFALRRADVVGSGLPDRGNNAPFEARVRGVMAERPPMTLRDLAIGGHDVIEILIAEGVLPPGSSGGPEVGDILQRLLEEVTDHPDVNDREKLLRLARSNFANVPRGTIVPETNAPH